MVVHVAECLVDDHRIESAREGSEGGGRQGAGVRRVQQPLAIRRAQIEQHGLGREDVAVTGGMCRGQHANAVGADGCGQVERLTGRDDVQIDERVRADPVAAQVDGVRRAPHVQGARRCRPPPGEQEGRVQVVGMAVRQQHMVDRCQ